MVPSGGSNTTLSAHRGPTPPDRLPKEPRMASQEVARLGPEELRQLRARDERVLTLDVRTRDARALNPHAIPGARWLPLADVVASSASLPRAATIVAYCT